MSNTLPISNWVISTVADAKKTKPNAWNILSILVYNDANIPYGINKTILPITFLKNNLLPSSYLNISFLYVTFILVDPSFVVSPKFIVSKIFNLNAKVLSYTK